MSYLLIKQAHILFAITSGTLFVIRSIWSYSEMQILQQRWVKISPHVIDSLLLLSAIALVVISNQYPWETTWLGAKVLALLVYIGLGTMAIKRGKTPKVRALFATLALCVFIYMFGVALNKHPASWALGA